MSFYSVMIDLSRKKCLVAGGGRVAMRKVIGLLRSGACVTVVSPLFDRHFKRITSRITMVQRPIKSDDIQPGLALVIAATDNGQVNERIFEQAQKQNILCNVVDCPSLCTFILPAVVRRGPVVVSVSTGGSSPRLARHIKKRIAEVIGPEYIDLASYMKKVRECVMRTIGKQHVRARFWEALFEDDPVTFIEENGWDAFCLRTEKMILHYSQEAGE